MSDENDADDSGRAALPEEITQALRRMSWDDKLAQAREARAKVLAGAEKRTPPRETFEAFSQPGKPGQQKALKDLQNSRSDPEEAHERPPATAKQTQTRNRTVAVIALSALTGAFVHWGATNALDLWQSGDQATERIIATPETAAPQMATTVSGFAQNPSDLSTPAAPRSTLLVLPSEDNAGQSVRGSLTALPEFVERLDPVLEAAGWESLAVELPFSTEAATSLDTKPVEIRLFIPARLSEDVAGVALETLSGSDTQLVSSARVPFTIRQTQVRFYHTDDAGQATETAEALGGVARDFTDAGRKPSPGQLEVYLAGDGGDDNRNTVTMRRLSQLEYYLLRILGQI